jgi:hypothetical protein
METLDSNLVRVIGYTDCFCIFLSPFTHSPVYDLIQAMTVSFQILYLNRPIILRYTL